LDTRKIDEEPTGDHPNPLEPFAEVSSTAGGLKLGEEAGRFVGAQVSNDAGVQDTFAQAGKVIGCGVGIADDVA